MLDWKMTDDQAAELDQRIFENQLAGNRDEVYRLYMQLHAERPDLCGCHRPH